MRTMIGVIGVGKVMRAFLQGLIKEAEYSPELVLGSNRSRANRTKAAQEFGIDMFSSNKTLVERVAEHPEGGMVIFAVKPKTGAEEGIQRIVREVAPIIREKKLLVVSAAAGLRTHTLHDWLGGRDKPIAIVRAMLNTPTSIRNGITAISYNDFVSDAQKTIVTNIFCRVGRVRVVEQEAMDAATIFGGCGPAIFWHFVQSFKSTAKQLGMDDAAAEEILLQTMVGAGKMALETGKPLSELITEVATAGGVTEAILKQLDAGGMPKLVSGAVQMGVERCNKLGDTLAQEPEISPVAQASITQAAVTMWHPSHIKTSSETSSKPGDLAKLLQAARPA